MTLERLARLDQEITLARENRLALWQKCVELIRERPLAGHGYGTFEQLFHLTRDARFERVWHTAHNTYLEHAVELGLPATFALYGGMMLLVALLCQGRHPAPPRPGAPDRGGRRQRPRGHPCPGRLQPADPGGGDHLCGRPGDRLRTGGALDRR